MADSIEELEDAERIIKKASQSSNYGQKGVRWDDGEGGYISETKKGVDEVVVLNNDRDDVDYLLEQYFKDNHGEFFDDWDEARDSASSFNESALNRIVFAKNRKGISEHKYQNHIEPGFYKVCASRSYGQKIQPAPSMVQDDYINLDVGVTELNKDIHKFFSNKDVFEEKGMTKKRSFLLYGPPGTGKTINTIHTCKEAIEEYGTAVILLAPDTDFSSLSNNFKEPLTGQNIIFIIEELTEIQRNKEQVLSFLDGEDSWMNTYTVGTTNFPEKLDKNLVDRPGRFDKVKKIDEPGPEARKKYLEHVTDREFRDKEIKLTEGYSFSYLRELALRMDLYGKSLKTIIEEFEDHKREIENQFDDTESVGF
jgi:hypothetical protein